MLMGNIATSYNNQRKKETDFIISSRHVSDSNIPVNQPVDELALSGLKTDQLDQ